MKRAANMPLRFVTRSLSGERLVGARLMFGGAMVGWVSADRMPYPRRWTATALVRCRHGISRHAEIASGVNKSDVKQALRVFVQASMRKALKP